MTQRKSTMTNAIPTMLIAPCGMNCRLCRAFTRDKKPCPGCRGDDSLKSPYCVTCRIANCDRFTEGGAKYCFDCDVYPCPRLKHLDKRYRTNYAMSMIANLNDIQQHGVRQFIRNEKKKWTCPECGELLSVHKPKCLSCGHPWR